MKKRNKVLLAILAGVMVIPLSVFPQANFIGLKNPAEFKQRLAAETRQVTTLSCDFIQEKNLSVISEKIVSKGHFFFKKEKKLRWEYTEPYTYLIIFRDDKIIVKDEDRTSQVDVRSNKLFGEINRIMIGCVQGSLLSDEKNFKATYFENNYYYLVKMIPLSSALKTNLSDIRIYFDHSNLSVTKLEMHESSGDQTVITFENRKMNIPVPDEKFTAN